MAITVGTDTYLSLADANTYWENRDNPDVWANATDGAKEAALREATLYIDGAYSFIGSQIYDNPLAWPRYDAEVVQGNFRGQYYDSETIPPQIKNACAELAFNALSGNLDEVQARGGAVKREKVDVIEVEYMDWAPSGRTFAFVSKILKPLLSGGGGSTRKLVRT